MFNGDNKRPLTATFGTVAFARSPSSPTVSQTSTTVSSDQQSRAQRATSLLASDAYVNLSRQLESRLKATIPLQQQQQHPQHPQQHQQYKNTPPLSPPLSSSSVMSSSPRSNISSITDYGGDEQTGSTNRLARVIYDFTGDSTHFELNIEADDIVQVDCSSLVDGWYWARVVDRHSVVNEDKSATSADSFAAIPTADVDPNENLLANGEWGWLPADYIRWLGICRHAPWNEWEQSNAHDAANQSESVHKHLSRQSPTVTVGWNEVLSQTSIGWFDSTRPFALSGAQKFVLEPRRGQSTDNGSLPGYRIVHGPSWYQSTDCSSSDRKIIIVGRHLRRNWLKCWTVYEIIRSDGSVAFTEECHKFTVRRRYSQFWILREYLCQRFPAIFLPKLPTCSWNYSMDSDALDQRQRGLERWLNRIMRHPILGSSEGFKLFLSCQPAKSEATEDIDGTLALTEAFQRQLGFHGNSLWSRTIGVFTKAASDYALGHSPQAEASQVAETDPSKSGTDFYEAVRHPEFNLAADEPDVLMKDLRKTWNVSAPIWFDVPDIITGDIEGAREIVQFARRTAVDARNLKLLLGQYSHAIHNDSRRDLKRISYALHRIFNHPRNKILKQPFNRSVIWCHREGERCDRCERLSTSVRSLAITFSTMGNVLTDYTQDIIKPLLERLDEFADDIEIRSDFLHKIHEDGASLGKSLAATLRKQSHVRQSQHVNSRVNAPIVIEYSTNDGPSVESLPQLDKKLSPSHVFSRLETVFNVNHAELNHWLHDERLTEWSEMLMTWLDGEIIRTEQCLQLLYSCRKVFSRNL